MRLHIFFLVLASLVFLGEGARAQGQVCPNGQCPIVREHQVQLRWQEQAFDQVPSYYGDCAVREYRSYYEPQGYSAPAFYYQPQPVFYPTYAPQSYYAAPPQRPRGLFVQVGVSRFRPGR